MRFESPRDGGGGASPKMKNLMKAPINSTTESCPSRKPCVKERLFQVSDLDHTPHARTRTRTEAPLARARLKACQFVSSQINRSCTHVVGAPSSAAVGNAWL